ncbi:MAG: hypothetical protein LBV67_00210 [Streptococcaceae bacterium]|jgi:uncharacterized coiled-coil DUF342 family protein|nr:hypothetical protein [Streptococcaceae bacterium]
MKQLDLLITQQTSLNKRISIMKQRAQDLPMGRNRDKIVGQILELRQKLKVINHKISIQKRVIDTLAVEVDQSKIIQFPRERTRVEYKEELV